MIWASKAGEEQITKGHHVGSPRRSVCFTVCVCKCLQTNPQAPKDDPALFKDELKTAEKLFHLFCCSSALDLQHWQHHFKHLVVADFFLVLFFYFLFFAEETNWKRCNCDTSLRLNSCNFHSLTSLLWEDLKQYIKHVHGDLECLNMGRNALKLLFESLKNNSAPWGFLVKSIFALCIYKSTVKYST